MLRVEIIIDRLELKPLPVEGGLFRETYRSDEMIEPHCLSARYASAKSFGSAIYYLLTSDPNVFSAMHKLPTDEIFHFYLGDPVEMLLLHPDGRWETTLLGTEILEGQNVQFVVPKGVWQGSILMRGGSYALLGTTMAPAYDPSDYLHGDRDELVRAYPGAEALILQRTR